MHPSVGRAIDGFLSRGEGLGPEGDPFGAPLAASETAAALDVIGRASFVEAAPPFRSPLEVPGTTREVGVLLQPAREGRAWCILALPYGGFRSPGALGLYAMHAALLRREGLGVAALELPFHGSRAMPGFPSGWGYVRADLGHTMRALAASAAEAMALARWLRDARGATHVTGLGLSLGASGLGLAAARGAPVDRLAFVAAVDSPASFYATGENREARRRTLRAAGFPQARVEDAFRPLAPSTHPEPPSPALFVVPEPDQVVPARTQEAWRATWRGEGVRLRWEGHGLALASPAVAARVAKWLGKQG